MNRFGLDTVAPVEVELFRQAPVSKRRAAALFACEHAVVAGHVTAPEVDEALAVLRGAAVCDASLRERLERLAARFDDEYFELDEDDSRKQEARVWFSKARATSALTFALAADDSHLHDAIYESIHSLREPAARADLVRQLERILG
jgi:hypothetical protein